MDRRESLKTLVLGGVASSVFLSCTKEKEIPIEDGDQIEEREDYGRTPSEEIRDKKLNSETFFSEREMALIIKISDIILPADDESVSASEAGVPEFIEFIVKDIPYHQLPMRGGLMWLNRESNLKHNLDFVDINEHQALEIIDSIAYPAHFDKNSPGPLFFRRMQNLVVTGYFTSKPGIKFLDYKGNIPNNWDGVPAAVLNKYGLQYDQKTLNTAVDPNSRNEIMNWDNYEV